MRISGDEKNLSRRSALLASATVGVALLSACSNSPAAKKEAGKASVTVGLTYTPNIQFAPFYAAKSLGYYSDVGLDVTLRHHGASESEFGALAAHEEDFINAGGDEMMQAHASGTPVVDIATLYTKYPVALIVPAGSPIRKASDLAGRTIGTPGPYGETYFALLAMLRRAGLTTKDVNVKYIGFTQQAALAGKKVDGVMGYVNNDAVSFARAGIRTRSIALDDGGDPQLVGLGIGALRSTLEKRPKQARGFVSATLRGVRYMTEHPAKTVDLSAPYIPTMTGDKEKKNARATLDATLPLVRGATGRNDPDAWKAMARFMRKAGLVKHSVRARDVYSNGFV